MHAERSPTHPAYVLNNARHGVRLGSVINIFTSGCWFAGWQGQPTLRGT